MLVVVVIRIIITETPFTKKVTSNLQEKRYETRLKAENGK